MKIAIIGDGLTGQEVVTLLKDLDSESIQISGIYNTSNPVTTQNLAKVDCAIVFVPATAMESLIPVLIESRVDVICGTTGNNWPENLDLSVTATGSRWILSNNFSLGMCLIRHCIKTLSNSDLLLDNPQFQINETHHIHKVDQPSGTAISWQQWLDKECQIKSTRQGEVKGYHQLSIETEFEKIELCHTAKDRKLFAQGVVWTIEYLHNNPELSKGVHDFSHLVDDLFEATSKELFTDLKGAANVKI